MDVNTITFLILGGLAGGFINGFSGTGTALFALVFFLQVLDPLPAVTITAAIAFISGLQGMYIVRHEIRQNVGLSLRFIIPGLIGVPLGGACLALVDVTALRLLVAGFLIFYGAYFGFRKNLPKFDSETPKVDSVVALIGGFLGGLAGLSGALPTIWLSMRPWKKQLTRAVLQPFNVAILFTTVVVSAINGALTLTTILAFAIAFPAAMLSVQLGIYAFRQVNDTQFRRTLIILCLAMGVGILVMTLLRN